jgi:methionyl-tRNA formyltransferase
MNQRKEFESASTQSKHHLRRFPFPLLLWIAILLSTNWFGQLPTTHSMVAPMIATTSQRFYSRTMFTSSIQLKMMSATVPSTVTSRCCGIKALRLIRHDPNAFGSCCTPLKAVTKRYRIDHHPQKRQLRLFSSNVDMEEVTPPSISGKKRVVFLGSPPVAAESLQHIFAASQQSDSVYDIVAVISQPPKRGKRGGKVEHTAVGQMAQQLNISTILTPEKANDPVFLEEFCNVRPDLCITAAYGQYLPKKFLQTPRYGTINIHPSLLPKWRGASPVQRSLEAGENPLGVTVLYTVSKMDAGPIITQSTLDVKDHETATTLLPKLFQIGTQSLISVLPKIFDETITMSTATIQNEEEVTYAKLIDTSEAEFKVWQESATSCHNRLRGFHMWPKANMHIQITNHNNTDEPPLVMKIKIHETRVISDLKLAPTDIIQTSLPNTASNTTAPATGLYVICYDGSVLELILIQPPSKKAYPARDLVHGYPNATIQWIQPPPPLEDDEVSTGSHPSKATVSSNLENVPTEASSTAK